MRIQSYSNFWQRIHRIAGEKHFPLRVMFELTYRCNFRCKHCYVPETYKKKFKKELKTKEIFSILGQLADIGCFYLGFTGGEPFLREDIFDILWYAKKKGFQLIIYTNGSLIDENKVQELKRLSPNKVDIAIPGLSKTAFECVSRVAGSRDKVFRAIDLLYRNGIKLGFKTCVLKENESAIKDIQDFAHSLGALHRLDDKLSPRLNGNKEPYRYRGRLREESIVRRKAQGTRHKADVLRQSGDFAVCNINTETRNPKPDTLFKCGVGLSQAAITPFGELKMCLMIDYPKYKILNKYIAHRTSHIVHPKDGLKYAWERLKELVASIKPDKNYQCDKCQLRDYCKWCPGEAWLYNRSFTSCEPESKNWAMQRKLDYEDRG